MLAVLCAGGKGTRLAPLTQFLNKHLAPIGYGELMIDAPLNFMAASGFTEIQLITGTEHAGQVSEYVGDGERYGIRRIDYRIQPKPLGIVDCLRRVEHLIAESTLGVMVMLADNYFSELQTISDVKKNQDSAHCWEFDIGCLDRARSFSQALRNASGEIIDVVEKPKAPSHSRILTGLYYFPTDVNIALTDLMPSRSNGLEITDLLRLYAKRRRLIVHPVSGSWSDLGEWPAWLDFVKSRT